MILKLQPRAGIFFDKWCDNYFTEKKGNAYYKMFGALDTAYDEFHKIFPERIALSDCPGGYKMHHTERGGLLQHYTEMINWMDDKNQAFIELRNFKMPDIIESVILHDISKPLLYRWSTKEEEERDGLQFRYIKRERNVPMLNDDFLTCFIINYFKLDVSWEVFVAVLFAEGGWSDAAKMQGCQPNQLGYFLHMADLYSSQFLGGKFEAGEIAK